MRQATETPRKLRDAANMLRETERVLTARVGMLAFYGIYYLLLSQSDVSRIKINKNVVCLR